MNKEKHPQKHENIRCHRLKYATLVAAVSSVLATQSIYADTQPQNDLETIRVEETITPETNPYVVSGAPYLAARVSDPRRTRAIAETPQTITVLTSTTIEESARSDLREILDDQPGITLGTGENGNAFGDRYVIRGHDARSDIYVDGLRDPGMTIRESFAVEQIEITKGPSSTFAGRGTTGGAVNSASKRASAEHDFTNLSGGVGSDNYHRVTFDTNHVINSDTAVRVNLLDAKEGIPDREPASRDRQGAAISLFHQPSDRLEFTADVYHFTGKDKPDLGTYLEDGNNDGIRNKPNERLPVYLQNEDFLESTANAFTLRTGFQVSPTSRIINLTRYGTTKNDYVLSGARGTTVYGTRTDAINRTNGFNRPVISTHYGWQDVDYFVNQFNFINNLGVGATEHELVVGAEINKQKVVNGIYQVTNNGTSNCFGNWRGRISSRYCIYDAEGNVVSNLNGFLQRDIRKSNFDADWNLDTTSFYVIDTIDLNDLWTVSGGLRYDYHDYSLTKQRRGVITQYSYNNSDLNWNLGASYAISNNTNLYANLSTATNLNGGESDVGTNGGYGGYIDAGNVSVKPEKTQSWEIGTKTRLNGDKLLATAAIFNITKDDVIESVRGGDYDSRGTANTGKNRVQGIEFGLAGNLTYKLSAHAGIAFMNAKILASTNSSNIGKTLANFADRSATLQLKYQATPKFAIGSVTTYESNRFAGQPDAAANETLVTPAYLVHDIFANYKFNENLSARLNLGNVANKKYYLAAYRSGAFVYKGDSRSVKLTFNYKF